MTPTETRELDAWLMWLFPDFEWTDWAKDDPHYWQNTGQFGYSTKTAAKFSPTTDHADAMMVLEKCVGKINVTISEVGTVFVVNGRDWERLNAGNEIQPEYLTSEAETLPLAICLFAKKLFSKS